MFFIAYLSLSMQDTMLTFTDQTIFSQMYFRTGFGYSEILPVDSLEDFL